MLIAALGSSFAAGPTLEPVADRAAMRSRLNYPHRLAAALGADLVDLTVSGATTATILDEPQVITPRVEFPAQINSLPPDAGLVTVTAGGNDLRYIGSMLATAWRRYDPAAAMTAMLGRDYPEIARPTVPSVDAVADGLARIVAETRVRASHARVVLVDYLTVLDPESRSATVGFTGHELAALRDLADALELAYRRAADRSGAELVAASDLSRGHGVGSAEPWVNDFIPEARRTAGSFHPNADGMAAVAAALVARLG